MNGDRIIKLVRDENFGSDKDTSVKSEEVAENFKCLILQVAMQESSLLHCGVNEDSKITEFQKNGDPFYCDEDNSKILIGRDKQSYGIMQLNYQYYNKEDYENFEDNVNGAISALILGNKDYEKEYECDSYRKYENYFGWEQSLRRYNGWGCNELTIDYVEEVIGEKDRKNNENTRNSVEELFDECKSD
jgi:hypothetical protein